MLNSLWSRARGRADLSPHVSLQDYLCKQFIFLTEVALAEADIIEN